MHLPRCLLLIACVGLIGGGQGLLAQSVIQTNYGTGDGSIPGPDHAVSGSDLLQTNLSSATRTGAPGSGDLYFYREDSGYTVELGRLTDGSFGTAGTQVSFSVLPNQTTLTFNFNLALSPGGYSLTEIRTYASWDSGRDGQQYTVQYATVSDPTNFLTLTTTTRFDNTDFPSTPNPMYGMLPGMPEFNTDENKSSTLVVLRSSGSILCDNVSGLRFVFNGVENGGTAYREFDVMGASSSAVPEPSAYACISGFLVLAAAASRRLRR